MGHSGPSATELNAGYLVLCSYHCYEIDFGRGVGQVPGNTARLSFFRFGGATRSSGNATSVAAYPLLPLGGPGVWAPMTWVVLRLILENSRASTSIIYLI